MSAVATSHGNESLEREVAAVLEFLYGKGMVYLSSKNSDQLFALATKLEFIDAEGHLTHKGRSLLARHYHS